MAKVTIAGDHIYHSKTISRSVDRGQRRGDLVITLSRIQDYARLHFHEDEEMTGDISLNVYDGKWETLCS